MKYLKLLITTLVFLGVGYWWYYTYTTKQLYELTLTHEGDTIKHIVVLEYTKQVITNNRDTSYIFYNKDNSGVIGIKKENIKNTTFKKLKK